MADILRNLQLAPPRISRFLKFRSGKRLVKQFSQVTLDLSPVSSNMSLLVYTPDTLSLLSKIFPISRFFLCCRNQKFVNRLFYSESSDKKSFQQVQGEIWLVVRFMVSVYSFTTLSRYDGPNISDKQLTCRDAINLSYIYNSIFTIEVNFGACAARTRSSIVGTLIQCPKDSATWINSLLIRMDTL